MRFARIFTATLALMILMSSCGNANPDNDSQQNTEQPDVGVDEDIKEVSYMTLEEYMSSVRERVVQFEPSMSSETILTNKYGTVEKVSYYSETCKRTRNVNVLLPAGYTEDKEYPVMYCLHGYWGNEDSLLDAGDSTLKITQILGNAIADGEAKEMILVFPYLYASAERDVLSGFNDESNRAYDNFINDLIDDLMPFIESNYSVATGRENTAITGFSMGGRESIYIGLTRSDLFGYVGAVCPAPGVNTDLLSDSTMVFENEAPYLFFISAGNNDSVVGSVPENYPAILENNGVDHVWHYVSGGEHGGNTIRPHMYNFVRFAFNAEITE